MARQAVPSYRRHSNGQAFVYHRLIASKSKRMYLGKYGSEESKVAYRRFLKKLEVCQEQELAKDIPAVTSTSNLAELVLAYDEYAQEHYLRNGVLSKEYDSMRCALIPLVDLYGSELAVEFGPKSLKTIQRSMAKDDYARSHINHNTSRIKRFFRWACSEELVPSDLYHKLTCVRGLQRGELGVKEAPKVRPACPESIEALLPFISPTVGAMLKIQYLCGMRPGEVCAMRVCDIDRSGDIWWYSPEYHKSDWRDITLVKAIPVTAQKILRPWMLKNPTDYIFRPMDSVSWSRAKQQQNAGKDRKTPRYPCEVKRLEKQKLLRQRRVKKIKTGEKYTTDSYRRAVNRGLEHAKQAKVKIEKFFPNQLRHAIVTYVSAKLGRQKAQRWAGHRHLDTTSIYDEAQLHELEEIARQLDAQWAE